MKIVKNGLPEEISPFIVAVTGYGNVSNGAQEIFNLLPVKEIAPEQIPFIAQQKDLPRNLIYRAVFKEKDLAVRKDGSEFDLEHYYAHPEMYKDRFTQYIPHLNGIVNGMYWDLRYPRIVTKEYLKKHFAEENPRLSVIGDITCDPDGSIQITHKGTEIENPVFVYHPDSEEYTMGFSGNGVLVMPVDILPSELPRESSEAFSAALRGFIPAIANADFNVSFDALNLPGPIKKATILLKGELTPNYSYIQQYLK
jgi:saccharopine dehydrogenase (NAD+, L-lysine forming)